MTLCNNKAIITSITIFTCRVRCVSVMCHTGQYRVGQTPGTCYDCPAGSYRNLTMENCTWCGDLANWRTEGAGKTSVDHCKCEYALVGRNAVLVADRSSPCYWFLS